MPSGTNRFFIDTNILLYAIDQRNAEKSEMARRLIDGLSSREAIVISPQVINEYCNVIRAKFRHIPIAEVQTMIKSMESWCTAETSAATALAALDLQTQMHVRFYDAVLLASARAARCTHFLSEDLQHDRLIGDMRILNPFMIAPDAILSRT